jgi:hypothetical protein
LHRLDILLRRVGCTKIDRDPRFPDVFGPHRSERLNVVGMARIVQEGRDRPVGKRKPERYMPFGTAGIERTVLQLTPSVPQTDLKRRVRKAQVLIDSVDTDFQSSIEKEVRYANITIIEGIGASQYGIGMVCARIAEIVLRDERAVIPIGVYNSKHDVTFSLPSIIGKSGCSKIFDPPLSVEEANGLERSIQTLQNIRKRRIK